MGKKTMNPLKKSVRFYTWKQIIRTRIRGIINWFVSFLFPTWMSTLWYQVMSASFFERRNSILRGNHSSEKRTSIYMTQINNSERTINNMFLLSLIFEWCEYKENYHYQYWIMFLFTQQLNKEELTYKLLTKLLLILANEDKLDFLNEMMLGWFDGFSHVCRICVQL